MSSGQELVDNRRLAALRGFQARLLLFVLALGVFILLGVAMSQAQTGNLQAKERELNQLRQQIDQHRRRAQELSADEQGLTAYLHEIEREMAATTELVANLDQRQVELEAEVAVIEDQIGGHTQRIDRHRERLAAHLRDMYVHGRARNVNLLLTSRDFSQFSTKLQLMTHFAREEKAMIAEVQDAQVSVRERRVVLDARLAEVYRNRSEAEERRVRLEALMEEREVLLGTIRLERTSFEQSVQELEDNARAVEQLIAELERSPSTTYHPTVPFTQLRGQLPWPAPGVVKQGFGRSVHPDFGTVVINKGINISAAQGTPIRAVAGGVAEYVNWLPGYGKCIIVNHGDGYYTLYAHAAEIFPSAGEPIAEGQVIAEVGDTGSLDGSQLYFEIRRGKEPVDPLSWLETSSR